jgi:hypothetical protein
MERMNVCTHRTGYSHKTKPEEKTRKLSTSTFLIRRSTGTVFKGKSGNTRSIASELQEVMTTEDLYEVVGAVSAVELKNV